MRFRNYLEVNDEQSWYVPPYFRKSGTKHGKRSHLVPCVGFAARAVDRLADFEDSKDWLFPASGRTKADREHAAQRVPRSTTFMAASINSRSSRSTALSFSERYSLASYRLRFPVPLQRKIASR
jgi:hypothetical protein